MDDQLALAARHARPPLEAVLFDAGGTLVRLDFEWLSAMLAELGVRAGVESLRRAEIHGRRRYDLQARAPRALAPGEPHPPLGSIAPTEAYLGGMLEAAGCRHPLLEEALRRMDERRRPPTFLWGRAVEGAREAVAGVRALGLRAAVVSNSDGRAREHLEALGVDAGLEFVVDSQLVGVEKPDPRIFGLALARLGLPPERALYVGDLRSVDAAGARAAGMPFVLLDPFGDYAAPGEAAVDAIAALPAWIATRFTTPEPARPTSG